MEAERFPFDYDALEKGWQCPPQELEKITGFRFGSPAYAFAVMQLGQTIERELKDRGRPVCVAQVKNCLRILTDPEAADHTRRQFVSKARGMARAHVKGMLVDVSQLSEDEAKRHAANQKTQAFQLLALREARKKLLRDGGLPGDQPLIEE